MTTVYRLQNGEELEFADDISKDEIKSFVMKNYADDLAKPKEQAASPSPADVQQYAAQNMKQGFEDSARAGKNLMIGASKMGQGVLDLGADLIGQRIPGAAPWLKEQLKNKVFPSNSEYQRFLGVPENEQTWKDTLTQALPQMAAASETGPMELPGFLTSGASKIPLLGKSIAQGLKWGVPQGILAGATSPDNRVSSALLAGGLTTALPGAASFADKGMKMGSELNPFSASPQRILKGVAGNDYKPVVEASERLGLPFISPAEAAGSALEGGPKLPGAIQNTVGDTKKGFTALEQKTAERAKAEQGIMHNFKNALFNPGRDQPQVKALYESANSQIIPEEQISALKDNEMFKDAESKMLSNASYRERLKGVPENSVQYLDMVKRSMSPTIKEASTKSDLTSHGLLTDFRNTLNNTIGDAVPEYRDATKLAQRGILRRNLENFFQKNGESFTPQTMSKYVTDDDKYSQLVTALKNIKDPEQSKAALQDLADIRTVFPRLIKNNMESRAAKVAKETPISGISPTNMWNNVLNLVHGRGNDLKNVNLMYSKDWQDALTSGNSRKMSEALYKLMPR